MLKHANKNLTIFILTLCITGFTNAQINDSIPGNNLTNDSVAEDIDFNLLMLSLSYTNNNIKYKNLDNSIKIPAYLADISFYHRSGIWASINYTNYYEAATATYDTELKLGYQKTFFDFMDLDFNYGYHHFKGDANYEGISYNHSLNGSLGLNSKYVSFNADVNSMYGISNNFFTDFGISLNLDIDDLIFKNDFLLFNPGVATSLGTDYWIFEDFTPLQQRGRKYYLTKHGYTSDTFEYQSTSFYVPIIYSYSDISLSFSWFYNIPSAKLKAINWEDQSGFMISIIYTPIF